MWQAWLAMQWQKPSRTDWYLMQLACEVRRGQVKNPAKVQPDDFRLRFETAAAKAETVATATQRSQAAWLAAVGLPVEVAKHG